MAAVDVDPVFGHHHGAVDQLCDLLLQVGQHLIAIRITLATSPGHPQLATWRAPAQGPQRGVGSAPRTTAR
jgi:hypothetical protein